MILLFDVCSGISFNQPKFSSCASWNTNATTLWNETHVGQQPTGIFINIHDKIYVTNRQNGRIFIWSNESFILNENISQNLINPWSIFVTDDDEIIVDNGYTNGRVDKWTLNKRENEPVMFVNSSCAGLFVDILSSLYCSLSNENRVFKLELNKNKTIPVSIAGTGCPGPVANMLDHPHGIFVDESLSLFVADTNNNRIQCFKSGQVHATTLAGFGAAIAFILNKPSSIVLDGDGNLYIVDSGNHRIIRSISNTFKCIVGCSGSSGSSSSQLNNPKMMAFDKNGNIFVTDMDNHRIQKFMLTRNSCVEETTTPMAAATFSATTLRTTTSTITSVCADNGTLVTFDDLPSAPAAVPDPYNNISWINGYYIHRTSQAIASGYYTATVSGNNSLFNSNGNPLSMKSNNGILIILQSAVAAAAWHDNLLLTVTGYRSNTIIRNQTFTLQVFTSSYLTFDGYSGLDTLLFSTSGGTKNQNVTGNGQHFAMDNICLILV